MVVFNRLNELLVSQYITSCSRGIRNAWHFYYALVLVFKGVCSSSVLRCSPLNRALVYKSRKGILFRELVRLLCFAPVGLLITGTFRWHYMGIVRDGAITYWLYLFCNGSLARLLFLGG